MGEINYDFSPGKKLFENIDFDEDGRYLLLHHNSAAKYYKFNAIIIMLFLGASYFNYKRNSAVFWNERFAKVYLGIIASGLFALWLFSNKHIHTIYLLKKLDPKDA